MHVMKIVAVLLKSAAVLHFFFALSLTSETRYCDSSSSSSWTLVSATFGPWSGLSGARLLVAARPTIFTHLNRGTFDPGVIQVWSRYAPGILQASY